jgi:hypothetical protein
MAHSSHILATGPIHPNDCGHRYHEYFGSIEVFEVNDDGTYRTTPVDVYVHGNDRQCLCIRHGSQGDYIGTTFRGVVGGVSQSAVTEQHK